MKRFHVHVAVRNLDDSVRFYSTIFGAAPSVQKPDYAKWMLDDPRINFAISERAGHHGVNHLGFQVDDDAELEQIHGRLDAAGAQVVAERDVSCCYARSDKYWISDPQGVAWESFRSLGSVPFYGDADKAPASEAPAPATGCCSPAEAKADAGAATSCCGSADATAKPAAMASAKACCG
jgi:catechol 2,3-dioxygenase-like lactoylglutathione lyase family enzyme